MKDTTAVSPLRTARRVQDDYRLALWPWIASRSLGSPFRIAERYLRHLRRRQWHTLVVCANTV